MAVTSAWLRIELRRRWRSLTVLALLIGIAATTVLAALAGARRGASAQRRLDERTLPATAMVLANVPGFDWAPVRRLPEVAALTNFVVDYTLSAVDFSPDGLGFPFTDHVMFSKIERPLLFAGRAIDPDRPDEVMVSPKFAAHTHKRVGDTLHIILATPQEVVNGGGSGPNHDTYHGPRVTLRIVGIGETSPSWGVDNAQGGGGVELSPGLYEKYKINMLGPPGVLTNNFVNALVRLHGGESALTRFSDDFHRVTGRPDIEVTDLIAQQRTAQHHIAFESRCLVAFAIAAFVAALFLIGQAIARYASASAAELRTLRALGMTPRQAVGAASAGPVLTGIAGALLGLGGAVIASRWLPFGSAGLIEPDPGIAWDWVVLGPGVVIVVLLVAAGAVAAAQVAVAAERRDRPVRRSAIATAVGQGRAPVPVVIGTRFALEAGRGRTAVPVRPALIGAVMGVLGILAAFTFSDGVGDAASHPERFGQTFQLGSYIGLNSTDFSSVGPLTRALDRAPTVSGIDDARTAVATASGGHVSVSLWEYSSGAKKIPMVVLSGRAPEAVDEVALAPQTLTAMRAHVGSDVTLTGNRKRAIRLHVVGSALVPTGPHNGYADGGWVTRNGYNSLFHGFKFHLMLITLVPSARTPEAGPTLSRALAKSDPKLKGLELDKPDPLAEVAELKEVERLPLLLGGFLALLAIGAVGHALATAVRRRSHDLAVLRALGMTQRQCRWVVVTQASVLAVIGLIFGVPLGLAIGRSVWRVVADYTPIAYVAPVALWALLGIAPAAVLIANLLAAWPGRRAARMRISHILRTE